MAAASKKPRMIIISRLLISLLIYNNRLSFVLILQYYNDGWSRLKKRPASKGHWRVALLEEEPGKLSLSNRKLRTSMVPPREIGRRRTTELQRSIAPPKAVRKKRLAKCVRQVPFEREAAAPLANSLFFSPSVSLQLSRVLYQKLSIQPLLLVNFLASKLRVGVQRPRRPGLITAESRQLRPPWRGRLTSGLTRATIRPTISSWQTCIRVWVQPRP